MTESPGGYANQSFTSRTHVYGGQDNTVLEIIEAVFAGVAPYADWRISKRSVRHAHEITRQNHVSRIVWKDP